ncbi:MAG: hypothetical protein OEV08_03225 [Nitrospira sp.]|nr:hypothetical protein [Nitrospira sp.]
MASDPSWVSTRINEAHKANPSVAESVLKNVEELLKAQMSERQLSSKELAEIAKTLIAANIAAPPEAEADK